MTIPPSRTRLLVAEENLRGYRGLTFDAFGSLLAGGPTQVPAVLRRTARDSGAADDLETLGDLWGRSLRKYFQADPFLSFREVHQHAFEDVFKALRISASLDECVDEAFDAYRRARAFPEVASVIHELEGDVALAVISNMETRLLLEALHSNGLSFSFVITSDEEQRYKPSGSLFRRAIRYLGLPAAHILHVGDSYAEDVVGASSVGMASALMRRTGRSDDASAEAGKVVHDLREVRDLVRSSWTVPG